MKWIVGILCQIAGLATMATGAVFVFHTGRKMPRYHIEEMYQEYNTDVSVLIFLGSIVLGCVLLWLGSRLKSKV